MKVDKVSIGLLISYLLVMHLAFMIEATIDTFDLLISIGICLISFYVYRINFLSENKYLKWLSSIILAGSVSNCIDEIFTTNTSFNISELIIWILLILYLNRKRNNNIYVERGDL